MRFVELSLRSRRLCANAESSGQMKSQRDNDVARDDARRCAGRESAWDRQSLEGPSDLHVGGLPNSLEMRYQVCPRMRIVHIITRLIVGGAQENTLLSCEGQHDRGHQVTLITGPAIGPEGSLMERARGYGYAVEVIEGMRRAILPGRDYGTYRWLVRRLRELRPDVVHTHSSKAGIIGRWAAARARVPVIIHTIHGLAFTASTLRWVNRGYELLERITAPKTTRIVCVADAMRDQSLAKKIGRTEQYVTVYSGMETGPFLNPPVSRTEVRNQLGLRDEHLVIGTIARLFDLKGHDDLLDLAPELCAKVAQPSLSLDGRW